MVIRENQIANVRSVSDLISIGLALSNCERSVVAGNTISNADPPNGIGVSIGEGCNRVTIEKNVITRWHQCIATLDGEKPDSSGASGRMIDNEFKCNMPEPTYQAWKVEP